MTAVTERPVVRTHRSPEQAVAAAPRRRVSPERVAAGLRELLRDPDRGPVLVLATLWPNHWATLTTRTDPDRHAQARELLDGHDIRVPDAFSETELKALAERWSDAVADRELALMKDPATREDARRLEGSGVGKAAMDAVRAKAAEIAQVEQDLLKDRSAASAAAVSAAASARSPSASRAAGAGSRPSDSRSRACSRACGVTIRRADPPTARSSS